jgi:hypothetical protein
VERVLGLRRRIKALGLGWASVVLVGLFDLLLHIGLWLSRRIGFDGYREVGILDDAFQMFYERYELYVLEKIKYISITYAYISGRFSISIQRERFEDNGFTLV